MTVKKTQLDEKIQTGGGATGVAHTADPVDKNATLPASHLGNGESMTKVASVTPGQGEEETSTENNTKPTSSAAASNKSSVAMKASAAASNVKEDVEAMFAGSELSEEFKEKATVIFEAAVTAKVNEAVADLEEQYNTALAEETVRIEQEMTEGINKYMEYVAEQWLEQNKVAVQASLKSELTESFIADLKGLFEQHYISIPEDKFDAVEAMQEEMAELQQRLDSVMEENMTLKSEVAESARAKILADVAEGLAATQAEKLSALAEGVVFDDADSFRKKLEIVKENYFPTDKPASSAKNLMEEVQEETEQKASAPANSPVSFYAQAISRTVKK